MRYSYMTLLLLSACNLGVEGAPDAYASAVDAIVNEQDAGSDAASADTSAQVTDVWVSELDADADATLLEPDGGAASCIPGAPCPEGVVRDEEWCAGHDYCACVRVCETPDDCRLVQELKQTCLDECLHCDDCFLPPQDRAATICEEECPDLPLDYCTNEFVRYCYAGNVEWCYVYYDGLCPPASVESSIECDNGCEEDEYGNARCIGE